MMSTLKTVQKAIESLKADGIIVSIPGAGSFIKNPEAFYGLKPFCIGLISSSRNRETPYYIEVAELVSRNSPEYNCSVSYVTVSLDNSEFEQAVSHLRNMDLDGYIIGPGDMGYTNCELRKLLGAKPFVVYHGLKTAGYDCIKQSNFDCIQQITHYLLDQGHRQIVLLKSRTRYGPSGRFLQGIESAWC